MFWTNDALGNWRIYMSLNELSDDLNTEALWRIYASMNCITIGLGHKQHLLALHNLYKKFSVNTVVYCWSNIT